MVKIGISKALEKRIRKAVEGGAPVSASDHILYDLVALLDKAAEPKEKEKGLGYRELVEIFRSELGRNLVLPPNPNAGWIVRQVARARDIGLDAASAKTVLLGLKRTYPKGPWELDFILRHAPKLFAAGEEYDREGDGGVLEDGGRGGQRVKGRYSPDD